MTVDTGSRDSTNAYFIWQILDFDERCDALSDVATMEAYNDSLRNIYEKKGIKKVVWFTSEDERTCLKICNPMHGIKFNIEETKGLLPVHINCRCVFIPEGEF